MPCPAPFLPATPETPPRALVRDLYGARGVPIVVFEFLEPQDSPVVQALSEAGFAVTRCHDVEDPRLADAGLFEAVVISMTGPSQTGDSALKLCRDLRTSGYRGAIVLVGTRRRSEGVEALERGADDFIARPLDPSEIVARLRAVLRRTRAPSPLRWGEIEVDGAHRTAYLRGRPLPLTGREYALLASLVEAAGDMVSRTELLRRVWKRRDDPGTNLIEVHVSRLREKLGSDSGIVETVRRAGYRLRAASSPADP